MMSNLHQYHVALTKQTRASFVAIPNLSKIRVECSETMFAIAYRYHDQMHLVQLTRSVVPNQICNWIAW